jgi:hypothetical protein
VAAAIGGALENGRANACGLDGEPHAGGRCTRKRACCEKASDTPERRYRNAHGRIGWSDCAIERAKTFGGQQFGLPAIA